MLSRRARSALAAMVDVARLARGKPLTAKALTARDGMVARQLEPVLQDLVRAGLLRSVRGPHGGYALARERRRISAGDIVRSIESPLPNAPAGDALEAAVAAASAAFLAHLDAVTLDDLCRTTTLDRGTVDADFHI